MVKLKRSQKHTYAQIHFAFKIPHCVYVLKMNLSKRVACFCSGFPGTSASSHPAPRVLRATKNVLGRLTIGKNCRTRNYLQYPGGSILESDVLKYWPFQLVKFYTHTLIFLWRALINDKWIYDRLMIQGKMQYCVWNWKRFKVSAVALLTSFKSLREEQHLGLWITWQRMYCFLTIGIHFLIVVTVLHIFFWPTTPLIQSMFSGWTRGEAHDSYLASHSTEFPQLQLFLKGWTGYLFWFN